MANIKKRHKSKQLYYVCQHLQTIEIVLLRRNPQLSKMNLHVTYIRNCVQIYSVVL